MYETHHQVSGPHRYKYVKRPVLGANNTDEELFGIHYRPALANTEERQKNKQSSGEGEDKLSGKKNTCTWSHDWTAAAENI